ncbi:hypothetical protein [Streptomyces sp. NPDC101166]
MSLTTTAARVAPGRDPAHVTDVYHAVRATTTVHEYRSTGGRDDRTVA